MYYFNYIGINCYANTNQFNFRTFLTKITNRMLTLFPLKITLIFIGCLGILLSIITSGFNKKLIKESYDLFNKKEKEILLPFDIIYKVEEKLNVLRSKFDCETFCRLRSNDYSWSRHYVINMQIQR